MLKIHHVWLGGPRYTIQDFWGPQNAPKVWKNAQILQSTLKQLVAKGNRCVANDHSKPWRNPFHKYILLMVFLFLLLTWKWLMAAPHNSARSLRQDFCPNSKFGKRRNTVCISRFSNWRSGAKRRLRLADAIVRCCLNNMLALFDTSFQ